MALPTQVRTDFGASFRGACGGCHPAERALAFRRSPEAWALTIERHRHFAPDHFDDAGVEAALDYLTAARSLSGADLFRVKCLACHREGTIDGTRSAGDWERIVDRISRYHPFFISPMEKRDVTDYLLSGRLTQSTASSEAESARRSLFADGCGRCHTLDIILTEGISDDAWPDILERMAGKVPGLMDKDKAVALADWIIRWRRNPDAFAQNFPHHRPDLFFKEVYD
jgi:mono/diheme cytochrome c family protein